MEPLSHALNTHIRQVRSADDLVEMKVGNGRSKHRATESWKDNGHGVLLPVDASVISGVTPAGQEQQYSPANNRENDRDRVGHFLDGPASRKN